MPWATIAVTDAIHSMVGAAAPLGFDFWANLTPIMLYPLFLNITLDHLKVAQSSGPKGDQKYY